MGFSNLYLQETKTHFPLKHLFCLIGLLSFLSFQLSAQDYEEDNTYIVSGKVINKANKEGISFAHINMGDSYYGVICDSLGFFRLRVNPNQQFKISALGFKEKVVNVLHPAEDEYEVFQEIFMEQESIMLQEVAVYSLGSWTDFKEEFIKTKVEKEEDIAESFNIPDFKKDYQAAQSTRREGFGVNAGAIVGLFKKKRKNSNSSLMQPDWKRALFNKKFNRDLVAELTKESGNRLDLLMQFINSQTNFTYQTSDYYIQNRIKTLHEKFMKENLNWDDHFSYTDSTIQIKNHLRP